MSYSNASHSIYQERQCNECIAEWCNCIICCEVHVFVAIAASQREVAPAASPTVAADEPAPANILLVQYVTGRDNAGNICLSFMDLSTEIEIVGEETVEDALRRFFTVESNAAELANWQVMRVGHGTQDTFNPAAHKAKDVKAVLLRRRGG